MQDTFAQFTLVILKMSKLVQKIKAQEMNKFDLKAVHVMCLYLLRVHPEGFSISELCRQTLDDKAAMSRAVAQLRERGFVTSKPSGHSFTVRLTEEGECFADYIASRVGCAVAAGSVEMTDEERSRFFSVLEEICSKLEQYYEQLLREGDVEL